MIGTELKEIAADEFGNILWENPYPFRRLFAIGQEQIVDSKPYVTISCKKIDGIIHHVLRRI